MRKFKSSLIQQKFTEICLLINRKVFVQLKLNLIKFMNKFKKCIFKKFPIYTRPGLCPNIRNSNLEVGKKVLIFMKKYLYYCHRFKILKGIRFKILRKQNSNMTKIKIPGSQITYKIVKILGVQTLTDKLMILTVFIFKN